MTELYDLRPGALRQAPEATPRIEMVITDSQEEGGNRWGAGGREPRSVKKAAGLVQGRCARGTRRNPAHGGGR